MGGVSGRHFFRIGCLLPTCSPLESFLFSQDGPVLGAVGSFSWSGGAFLYPKNKNPTFINMSQEHVGMRDSYLGETRLWLGTGQKMGCLGRTGAPGVGDEGTGVGKSWC